MRLSQGARVSAERDEGRPLLPTRAVAGALALVLVCLPILNAHIVLPWTLDGVEPDRRVRWWLDIGFLVVSHACIVATCIGAVRLQGRDISDIGLTRRHRVRWLLGLFAVGAIALIGVQLRRLGVLDMSADPRPIDPHSTLERSVFAIEGLFVGACQEVMWRGFGIRGLMAWPRVGTMTAVAVTSISFGYYHGGLTQQPLGALIALTLVGALLAALYLWRRDLWPALFLHASFNAIGAVFL